MARLFVPAGQFETILTGAPAPIKTMESRSYHENPIPCAHPGAGGADRRHVRGADPAAARPGLAVGCLVSNLVGLGMGANPAGAWDLLFGPLATLAAALLTWRLRNLRVKGVPVLASLPPVVINAVVVGLELTLVSPVFTPQVLAINMLSVGIGQLLACTVCGLLLHAALERSGAAAHLFGRRARI